VLDSCIKKLDNDSDPCRSRPSVIAGGSYRFVIFCCLRVCCLIDSLFARCFNPLLESEKCNDRGRDVEAVPVLNMVSYRSE
jgi:hypothetical protein